MTHLTCCNVKYVVRFTSLRIREGEWVVKGGASSDTAAGFFLAGGGGPNEGKPSDEQQV